MNKRNAENKSCDLVDKITKERISQNISRSKLAKNLHMSTTTISKIEEHQQSPKLSTLILIADFLGLDITISKKNSSAKN